MSSDRIELSFKNKEIRMWAFIMVPTVVVGFILLYFAEEADHFGFRVAPYVLLMLSYAFYYIWRYRYRKKKKDKG
ncbi:hypothetical protein ACFOZY_00685 [Chungangia koreensis]|uniref:Uncharacterized protein n=1 Tax=Chungangia koreensis TaxID=752657 RepID=A0ABV8WZM0_9LACT